MSDASDLPGVNADNRVHNNQSSDDGAGSSGSDVKGDGAPIENSGSTECAGSDGGRREATRMNGGDAGGGTSGGGSGNDEDAIATQSQQNGSLPTMVTFANTHGSTLSTTTGGATPATPETNQPPAALPSTLPLLTTTASFSANSGSALMLPKIVPIAAAETGEGPDCHPVEASEHTGHAPLAVEGPADGAPLIRIESLTSAGSQSSRVAGEDQPLATKSLLV
jgi:hypothetical protein